MSTLPIILSFFRKRFTRASSSGRISSNVAACASAADSESFTACSLSINSFDFPAHSSRYSRYAETSVFASSATSS